MLIDVIINYNKFHYYVKKGIIMKKISKTFMFIILPITILILCTYIGHLKKSNILLQQGLSPTMSSSIEFLTWVYRGIYLAILTILISYISYKKLTLEIKLFVLFLLVILNIPLLYLIKFAIYLPFTLLIIPLLNLIILIPIIIRSRK